jgi:hypothetical protein
MFTFDNTNKTKHDPCFYEALDLEEVVLSPYATYTMSCQKLRWKMENGRCHS